MQSASQAVVHVDKDNDFVFLFVVWSVEIHNLYLENHSLKKHSLSLALDITNARNNQFALLAVFPSDVALIDDGSKNSAESFSTRKSWSMLGLACVTVSMGKWASADEDEN